MDNQFIVGEKPKLILKFLDGKLTTTEYTFVSDEIFLAAVNDPDTTISKDMADAYVRFIDYDRVEMESAWYYTWNELKLLQGQAELNIFDVQRKEYLTNILSRLEDGVYINELGEKVYVNQGMYYPYLKNYRGIQTESEIPEFKFELYPNFFHVNTLAFRYHNSSLLDVVEENVIEKCRKFLIDQARILREVARFNGFMYDGQRFSGDRIVQADISGILIQYQFKTIPIDYVYRWKITNGSYYDFHGFEGTLDFSQKLAQFISVAFAREEVIMKDIMKMSLEELMAYDIAEQFSHINTISFDKTEPMKF